MEKLLMKRFLWTAGLLYIALLFSACGKLENPYSITDGIARMNAVRADDGTVGDNALKADPFAEDLAVPGTTDFNADRLNAEHVLLVENTDGQSEPDSLAYKDVYSRVYPASITKVMTALVCLENKTDLSEEFTVTGNSIISVEGSSTAFLREGETLTIEDLLYGMLLPSGNDAAVAVAEATAGSTDDFVKMMNLEALKLGCTGTHFVNPNGLPDDGHYTTTYDIYLILRKAMQYDEFRKIVGTASISVTYKDKNGMPKTQTWKSSNKYLTGEDETPAGLKVLGGKTGTTKAAGYCLAQSAEKMDQSSEYISIVMKAESRDNLYENMTDLLGEIH